MKNKLKKKILIFMGILGLIFTPLLVLTTTQNLKEKTEQSIEFIQSSWWSSEMMTDYAPETYFAWEGGYYYGYCDDIITDNSSNIFMTGVLRWNQSEYIYNSTLVKFDKDMNILWSITLGEDYSTEISLDIFGNPVIIMDNRLIKINSNDGKLNWSREFNASLSSIHIDKNNMIYLSAINTSGIMGSKDILLMKCEQDGTQLWNTSWGTSGREYCYQILADNENNTYISGYTDGLGAGGKDALLAKFNDSGYFEWHATFGAPEDDWGGYIALDSNGDPYLAGTMEFHDDYEIFVVKYNKIGERIWHFYLGSSDAWDRCVGLYIDNTNDYLIICGETYYGNWDRNFVLYQLHVEEGFAHWRTHEIITDFEEYARASAMDAQGNIYFAGTFSGWPTFNGSRMGFLRFGIDSDDDGISDYQELNVYNTDPNDEDTDGDWYSDGWEVAYGYDPLDPKSNPDYDQEDNSAQTLTIAIILIAIASVIVLIGLVMVGKTKTTR